jgi:hypothetical protein
MNNQEDLQGNDVHRFRHFDNEAEVELLGLEEAHPIEDSLRDNRQESNLEGYVSLPGRLPLGIFIGFVIQFLVLVVGGTSIYTSMKAEQAALKEQVSRIEINMYTKSEALLRLEMQKAELDNLRSQVEKEKKQ